ncbi:MAG: redox-regulated ATPase YchF [Thermoplasmata archaeon]|nr:redox-regulated ATPase YchF [Thermoplasmata archaeon]
MEIGIVGKPNVGKSTFFSSLTMIPVEIASYPFTTIDANIGVAYVRAKCPHAEFGVECNPNNAPCEKGTRLIPVKMIDVAGLVPDAHKGRGLGNKFLDDLMRASALIHIVDASGSTDEEGNPCKIGEADPMNDVEFLEREINHWIVGILQKEWHKMSRRSSMEGEKQEKLIHERIAGLGITETEVYSALKAADNPPILSDWTDDQMLDFAKKVREISKPMLIAANKCDIAPKENIERMDGIGAVSTSAEMESALRKAAKGGLIEYEIGSSDFKITDEDKLTKAQSNALQTIKEYIGRFGSLGVQKCLERSVYDLLNLVAVFPVEDENKLTDKQGRVLPDAYLMPQGSSAKDLAYKVHSDLGDNFIKAINARTKRVVGSDYALQSGDIITIVAR